MKKIALLLFSLALPGSAMAYSPFLTDVTDSCGYDVFGGAECLGCHVADDTSAPTPEKDLYLAEGACAFCSEVASCSSAPPTEAELLADARAVTKAYFEDLFGSFIGAMMETAAGLPGGMADPDIFAEVFPKCPDMAPILASKYSRQNGYLVRRVTTLTRNSRNMPDDWELKQLNRFEKMAAAGQPRTQFDITKPDGSILPTKEFEAYEVVIEGSGKGKGHGKGKHKGEDTKTYFRYMRSITMPGMPNEPPYLPCLKCHGTDSQLGAGVQEAVKAIYPYDMASGYSKGDVRGAWTIKIPLLEMPGQ
ncbi:MAG: DUF3365 domain-containing protein [Gammaproteobacteria bacterium]|nr:DUF3365 domain-containing protein [Gammaproteobacteria bacterium]